MGVQWSSRGFEPIISHFYNVINNHRYAVSRCSSRWGAVQGVQNLFASAQDDGKVVAPPNLAQKLPKTVDLHIV